MIVRFITLTSDTQISVANTNTNELDTTVEPPNNGHVWDPLLSGHFVFVERLSVIGG